MYREFRLPFLKNIVHTKFRLGVYYTNFTNHSDPLAVFNNVASRNFGQFTGFQHRLAGFVFETAD